MVERTTLEISKNQDGSFEFIQRTGDDGTISVRLLFIPSRTRNIETVMAKNYFELLNEEMKNSGLSSEDFLDSVR